MTTQIGDQVGNAVFTDVVQQAQSLGSLNAANNVQLRGQASVQVQITGSSGTNTIIFQVTTDNSNFTTVVGYPVAGGPGVTSVAGGTNGAWWVPVSGAFKFQVLMSAFTSGSALVSVIASQGTMPSPTSTAGNSRVDLVAENGTALGTPTNFGTTPGAVVVIGANASLFVGTTAVTAAIAGAPDVNAKGWGGTALGTPTNFGTTPGAVIAGSVNSSTFIGTVVAVAAAAGIQKVGISGNAAATIDGVITAAAAPANGLAVLVENVTTAPSLTTGQSVMAQSDYQGSLFVKPYRRGQTVSQATTISATGATTILAAQAAGIFADIAQLIVTTPPLAAPSSFTISLSDGTKTFIFDLSTGFFSATVADSASAPFVLIFDPPLAATTAATAWTLNESVANTIHVTVNAVLQKAS